MRLGFALISSCWLLALSVAAAPALKLDSLTVGSTTYRQVTVLRADATDLYFSHAGGLANVKLKYLSLQLQQRFGYDSAAARQAEQHRAEGTVRFENELASNLWARTQQASESARRAARSSEETLADPVSDSSLLGKPLPDLAPEKWLGEKPVGGKKCRLIAFWAPWSLPCRKWIPEWNGWQKKYAGQLQLLGISTEPEGETAATPGSRLEFPCGLDPQGAVRKALGVTSVPSVLLVDVNGVVRYAGHPGALNEQQLQRFFPGAAEPASQKP